jgi:hypothetical protein
MGRQSLLLIRKKNLMSASYKLNRMMSVAEKDEE